MSWKMMLRTKGGKIDFKVIDPATKTTWIIHPDKDFTAGHVMWIAISPDIIWQYAQRLKREYAKKGIHNVEVYALGKVTLNRNTPRPLVDTSVNLAAIKWDAFKHSNWITSPKGNE